MLSIVIIEDDPISSDLIQEALERLANDIQITAVLRSVKDGVKYLSDSPKIDLILSDVQLKDGLSFEIFEKVESQWPIIFISAYDQYVINAFEYSGIDYVMKPVETGELRKAIGKYRQLQDHFGSRGVDYRMFAESLFSRRRSRLIVKKASSYVSLLLEDVVFFFTENLVVYAMDHSGSKFMVDKNLNALEEELDPRVFFRANRQYIVNVRYVTGYKIYERVKFILMMKFDFDHVIVIGQEKAKLFRKWLAEA